MEGKRTSKLPQDTKQVKLLEESTMALYPNHIIIKSNTTNNQDNLSISMENLATAARNIKGEVPFKFYMYLCSMPNGYEFDYVPQEFAKAFGVSAGSAYSAADKLIKAGYLVESESRKNDYYFTSTI